MDDADGLSPDDMSNAEVYEVALRVAAKLMAFKALKRGKISQIGGQNWLSASIAADRLADEYASGRDPSQIQSNAPEMLEKVQ